MTSARPHAAPAAPRQPWTPPRVSELPRLTELTLQTGSIPGECEPGTGSTCF